MASIVVGILPTRIKFALIRNTLFRKFTKGASWKLPLLGTTIYGGQ
jgi:hypothetical protein